MKDTSFKAIIKSYWFWIIVLVCAAIGAYVGYNF